MIASLLAAAMMMHVQPPAAAREPVAAEAPATAPLVVANRLADWQLQQLRKSDSSAVTEADSRKRRGWEQAVFWIGMTALADAEHSSAFRNAVIAMGNANGWRPGDRLYHADDTAITQDYLWAATHGAGPTAMRPTIQRFDRIVRDPARVSLAYYQPPDGKDPECLTRWCWCDALFMAPPAMVQLSEITGAPRYRQFAMRECWATTDFLFDPTEHLYYRDSRFFERRDAQGRKLFWSRGNGWVFAGMARMIPMLPKGSRDRRRMERLFVEMAFRLKALQKPDGYWAPSLLSPEDSPPESSGTAFFTYGLAWGISAGLIDRAAFEPTVRRGWSALVRSIQPDGRLGWVQQVSDRPDRVQATDTQSYGVGAFLLAATALQKLGGMPSRH
jgi:rhamnogalacturonyl hydrolase YesR